MAIINLGRSFSLSGALTGNDEPSFPFVPVQGNPFPNFKPRSYLDWEWTIEEEYEHMQDAYAEKLAGWKHVLIAYEQQDACALWAISDAVNFWLHRESELLDCYIFWFYDPKDAVYAKLTFGGAA